MRKCVFLDRDGIINERVMGGYVDSWASFKMLPEFPGLLHKVSELGYVAIVVTNQRGVARGIMTQEAVDEIHANLRALLTRDHGVSLLDVMVCPHERSACDCRKPQPKLLLDAAARHDLDLGGSWMIGDTESDVEAGRRAGCRTILVAPERGDTVATVWVPDMATLVGRVEELLAEQP